MNKMDGRSGSVPLNQHSSSLYIKLGLDHLRGGTVFSLRDGRDGHVASVARMGPEESALPWRKTLI